MRKIPIRSVIILHSADNAFGYPVFLTQPFRASVAVNGCLLPKNSLHDGLDLWALDGSFFSTGNHG